MHRLAQQRNGSLSGSVEEKSEAHTSAEEFVVEDVIVSDMEGMGLDAKAPKARAGKESVRYDVQDIMQGDWYSL